MADPTVDVEKAIEHVAEALRYLGLDAETDMELQGTPERIVGFWQERFEGLDHDKAPDVRVLPTRGDQEDMVVIRDIPFASTCAHHFTPFFGRADIAYIPGESLIGVGTPARVVQYFSKRPQIQERLGEEICGYLTRGLNPRGLIVHLTARQMCMELRGAKSGGIMETTSTRGWFSDAEWRNEFFDRVGRTPQL